MAIDPLALLSSPKKGVTLVFANDNHALHLDATVNQSHPRSSDVTKHKVEKGVDISDHIQPAPKALSISGVVAYAPVVSPVQALANVALGPDRNRHKDAFDRIEKAVESGELVSVTTGLRIYENMAITSFSPTREAKTGFDLIFSMSLEEVRFVTAATVKIPKSALGVKKPGASKPQANAQVKKTQQQATPKAKQGQKPKKPATAPQAAKAERPRSVLKMLFG